MKKAFSLVELMVALGVFVLVSATIIFLVLSSQQSQKISEERAVATQLAQEAMEALRSIRDRRWNELETGPDCQSKEYGLKIENDVWKLSADDSDKKVTLNNKEYIRLIKIDCVLEGNPPTSNPNKRKITVEVKWGTLLLRTVNLVSYLTNWRSADLVQNKKGDFQLGIFENTKLVGTGQQAVIKLDNLTGPVIRANEFLIDGFTNTPEITTGRKISFRFTAQNSGTVNNLRVYLGEVTGTRNYKIGLKNNSGGDPGENWLCYKDNLQPSSTGWLSIDNLSGNCSLIANTIYHLVIEPQ